MSTIKTINVQHPNASSPAITLDSAGAMTGSFPYPNRNLIYNGAMQVAQRGTSTASITTNGYYTADRWSTVIITQGTWTQDIQNDAPTGSGFRRSFRLLCTTADAAPAAGDLIAVDQILEGQDLQRIAKGTSSAQQMTLSFWVKSNITGTYCISLYDNDSSPARQFSAAYTISASATWEKKTIIIPADTTGPFDNDNAASLYVRWYLGAGSTRTSGTLASAWATFNAANECPGQTNLAAATNNYWQITGIQLETGSVATPFEFKSFGQELRECQRYYYRITPGASSRVFGMGQVTSSTGGMAFIIFPTTLRIAPTALEQSGTASDYYVNTATTATPCNGVPTFGTLTTQHSAHINWFVSSGVTAGNATILATNAAAAYLAWSAEL